MGGNEKLSVLDLKVSEWAHDLNTYLLALFNEVWGKNNSSWIWSILMSQKARKWEHVKWTQEALKDVPTGQIREKLSIKRIMIIKYFIKLN